MNPEPDQTAATAEARSLQRRARLAVVILGARTVALQILVLVGEVFLARLLGPGDYGIYWGLTFVQRFLSQFSEAGFAASLIQKKETPTQRELSSVWWAQLGLALLVTALVWLLAPFLPRLWPSSPPSAVWLLRVLSLQFLLSTLRVIPATLLERELRFTRLSVVDFLDKVVFYVVAIFLALHGNGAFSLVAGLLSGSVVAAVLLLSLRPFRPSLVFDRALLRPILRFAYAYQAKSVLSTLNEAATPIYGTKVLGSDGLGINGFGQGRGWFPLRFVEIVGRVSFPLYSRLQDDPRAFTAAVERALSACALVVLFYAGLMFGLGPAMIHVVYTDKWMPAVPVLYVYSGVLAIAFVSPVVGSALDAAGKPQVLSRLIAGWTIVNWISIVGVTLVWKTPLAFALAFCVHVVLGNAAVLYIVRDQLPGLRVGRTMVVPTLAAVATGSLGHYLLLPFAFHVVGFTAAVLLSAVAFLGFVHLLDRQALGRAVALFRKDK